MEVLMWYALFAVTTSLAAMYELFVPTVNELKRSNPEHNVVEYKYITYFVFFTFTLALAPLILPACLVPSIGNTFRKALLQGLV